MRATAVSPLKLTIEGERGCGKTAPAAGFS